MQFQAYNKIMIEKSAIKPYAADGIVLGYSFRIRYPSYRGTFLSCIEKLRFTIDGESIAEKDVRFQLNGKEFLLLELKEQYKEYWFTLDAATVVVLKKDGLSVGEHQLTVEMQHRIPYAGYGGKYLALPSIMTQTLVSKSGGGGF